MSLILTDTSHVVYLKLAVTATWIIYYYKNIYILFVSD